VTHPIALEGALKLKEITSARLTGLSRSLSSLFTVTGAIGTTDLSRRLVAMDETEQGARQSLDGTWKGCIIII